MRIFADVTAQVIAFIRFDLSNQRHPRSISVKFGIAASPPAKFRQFALLVDQCYTTSGQSTTRLPIEFITDERLLEMAKRINKCIELLEQGQPIYATHPHELSYEAGLADAKTWADMLLIDFEHQPFDTVGLTAYMRGLRDGGPTASGHLTPTVICTLPSNAITPEEVRYNAWQARHVLTTGAHGILHTHTRTAESVKAFVQITRYPFQSLGRDVIGEGLRGAGGQKPANDIWGLSTAEYAAVADPWPLNPKGELLLGLKIEDRHCLPNVDAIAAVPGIGFAEWGPGDMGMSFDEPDAHDPPYPQVMNDARSRIKAALDVRGIAFYSSWADPSLTMEQRLDYSLDVLGVRMMGAPNKEWADYGRKRTGRTMPV